jgi:16S rRNA (cytidine1402-2'-O)-methyltransferase
MSQAMSQGKIYMGVNILGTEDFDHSIPPDVKQILVISRFFIVESIKNARRFLRKLDRSFPIDESVFFEMGKHVDFQKDIVDIKAIINNGNSLVVLSDAGCSGVADPGAMVASWAHENQIHVHPLVGPSSILLTLMSSGFNGQRFRFHGYLPRERKERQRALKDFEKLVKTQNETQLFMDTPFRNMHVLEDMFEVLEPHTMVCVAANLTHPDQYIKTVRVSDLEGLSPKIEKMPLMFAIGK